MPQPKHHQLTPPRRREHRASSLHLFVVMIDFELSIWLEEVRSLLETLEVSSPSKRTRNAR